LVGIGNYLLPLAIRGGGVEFIPLPECKDERSCLIGRDWELLAPIGRKEVASPCSMPQTRGMTWRIWLQVESSIHSWRASRQPRLEVVGVGENIPANQSNNIDLNLFKNE
jgi:hypothetical protein